MSPFARALRSALPALGLAAALMWAVSGWTENSSTLSGRVADTRDHPIEQATVTLSGDGVATRRVRSDAEGRYRWAALRPNTVYALTVERDGYRTVEFYGLRPELSRTRVVDFRLKRPGERDVVILAGRDPFPFQDLVRSFMSNVEVPVRLIDLDDDPNPEEAVRRTQAEHPDLIVGAGLRAARLIRREVRTIPSILTLVTDPRQHDLLAPNLCFVAMHIPPDDLVQRIKAILPGARRLGVLFDAETSSRVVRDLRGVARRSGLASEIASVFNPRDLEKSLDTLAGRIDILTVPYDGLTSTPEAVGAVSGWALRHRIPLAAPGPEWVRRGALFSYGVTQAGMGMEAASMAVQMLFQGGQPSDFPRQVPPAAFFAVNHETVEALGVRIPGALKVDQTY